MINLISLNYFITVAETGNITKAADKLFLTQPALSKAIIRLEQSLGFSLFDRTGNSIGLNENGKLLYDVSKRTLTELDAAVTRVRMLNERKRSRIRTCSVIPVLLSEIAAEFLKMKPEVRITTTLCSNDEIIQKMLDGMVDLAIVTKTIEDDRIKFAHIATEEILFFVDPANQLAERKKVAMKELSGEVFLFDGTTMGMRENVVRACIEAGFVADSVESNESRLGNSIRKMDNAVSMMPMHMYGQLVMNNSPCDSVPLRVCEPVCTWDVYLASRRDKKLIGEHAEFYSFVLNSLSAYPSENESFLQAHPEFS